MFVDSEVDTWNMNPVLLEKAIKDRTEKTGKTPKAIVPVALYGMPYKVDEEGLTQTENELIHIGKPLEFDENEFFDRLQIL